MEQLQERAGALASRYRFIWTVAAPLAATVCLVTLALPTAQALAAPIAVAAGVGVVLHPIVGFAGVVFGSQIGGVIDRLVPGPGDWALEALAALVLVGVAVNTYREPRERRWGPDVPGVRLAVLFGVVVLISCVFADDRTLALTGLRKLVSLLLLLYLTVRLTHTRGRIRVLIFTFVAATAFSGATGIAGFLTGRQFVATDQTRTSPDRQRIRQSGASSDDATAASRPLLAGTAIALVLTLRDRKRRLFYGVCGLLGLVGVVLTFSRSTSLVLVPALGWLLWKLARHRRAPLVLSAAMVLSAVGLALVPASYWQRLSSLSSPGEDWTLSRRIGYQLIGIDLLLQHPLLGVGPDNYQRHYLNYKYRAMPGRRLEARSLHNMYLSVAVETGLLGFVCFAGILFVALRGLARVRARAPDPESRFMAEALQFALVVFLVTCLFGAAETSKCLWILVGLAMALAHVSLPQTRGRTRGMQAAV